MSSTVHKSWLYKPDKKKPLIMVVGQNPGKSKEKDKKAFIGNKSGKFIMDLLEKHELTNVYLTNVCDSEYMNESNFSLGKNKLYSDIRLLKPHVIIVLGKIALYTVKEIEGTNWFKYLISVPHPGHALRFNLDDEKEWINTAFADVKELIK